jgi:signal transduction histidine kinase/CheY-like chemotaxis protein/HPt (histidine-containing phosphotransfer) domain-containing protein
MKVSMFRIPRPQEGRLLRISVFCVSGILLALCGLLWWQTRQLKAQRAWVDHSYQVRVAVEELDRSLREAESSQRALLLVGEREGDDLRQAFRHFGELARGHCAELQRLVVDNPVQRERVRGLAVLLDARLAELDKNSRELRSLEPGERQQRIREGIESTERIDRELEKIRENESRLLDERAEVVNGAEVRMLVLAVGGSAFGVVVLFLTGWLERRNQQLSNRYQTRLAEARDAALDSVKTTSNFVASVSHEIRTPMNGVLGAADLLYHDARLSGKQRELVDTIRISGQSLLDLINDILDLSKLRSGKMDFIREDFVLSDTIEEVLAMFSDAAGRSRLDLAYRIDADVPRVLRGDPRRLRQVLVNLVGNAVKFTERGSVLVEVSARPADDDRPVLRFRVIDTGPGISEEQQERLFEPFSQVNASLSRKHHGTGLGLAISREIVHHFEGTMGVESRLGAGATFWFTARFHAAHSSERPSARLCRGGTLLLVEGRHQTAQSIEHHALAWGMKVVIVTDTSVLHVLSPVPDLVAVVIGQPLGSSWQEIAVLLSERADLAAAPRFVLASLHETISPDQLAEAGVRATLRFPFRPSELYNLLADDSAGESAAPSGTSRPAPELAPVRLPAVKILLVEDNLVNQRVFSRQLEQLGLEVEICDDGPAGVEARCRGGYAAILMDCQLPTMDGFEATRRIRAWERRENAARLPIIAVTAHVMAGDAEACFQAGMDDYLPKPFDLAKLQRMLAKWLPQAEGGSVAVVKPDGEGDGGVLDMPQFESCLIGDPVADGDLIGLSLTEAAERLREMCEASAEGDAETWRRSAHRAKGSCATLGFRELAAWYEQAENHPGGPAERAAILEGAEGSLERTRLALARLGVPLGN